MTDEKLPLVLVKVSTVISILAEDARVGQQVARRWLRGRSVRPASRERLESVARALGIHGYMKESK
jgi:hypothetical protein